MSKVEFNIGDWRNKHIIKEAVGGVVSRRAFGKMNGMFRTETVDHIDDTEAAQDYDELSDKDLDNDGDLDLIIGSEAGTLYYFRNTGS